MPRVAALERMGLGILAGQQTEQEQPWEHRASKQSSDGSGGCSAIARARPDGGLWTARSSAVIPWPSRSPRTDPLQPAPSTSTRGYTLVRRSARSTAQCATGTTTPRLEMKSPGTLSGQTYP
jgi:hypothetical protein